MVGLGRTTAFNESTGAHHVRMGFTEHLRSFGFDPVEQNLSQIRGREKHIILAARSLARTSDIRSASVLVQRFPKPA